MMIYKVFRIGENKDVADMLKVSSAMVEKCRTGIRKKLGITEARGCIEALVAGL